MDDNKSPKSDLTPEQILAQANLSTPPDTSFRRIWIMLGIIVFLAITTSIVLGIINSKMK